MKKHDHHLFLNWLILAGVIIFLILAAWHQDLFYKLFTTDKSKISIAICLIYVLGMLHCGIRAWLISKQQMLADRTINLIKRNPSKTISLANNRLSLGHQITLPSSLTVDFLVDTIQASHGSGFEENRSTTLAEIYLDKLKASHEYGWFFVDAMIKLGLLGTIVGFIFMLGSVSDTSALDLNAMQKVMQQMSTGMGTALYTTLAGLIGSLLLALQYHMLDRGADDLLQGGIHLAEVHILPKLVQKA